MAVTREAAKVFLFDAAATINNQNHQAMVLEVLNDHLFWQAPGSSKWHHDYLGGLAHHTAEVVDNCVTLMGAMPFVERDTVLVAAFFHDWMKTHEYEYELETFCPECPCDPSLHGDQSQMQQRIKQGSIKRSEWGKRISHVVGSVLAFHDVVRAVDGDPEFRERVTHVMLAHHGRHEWRSPVEPCTPEAWILHAADMLSAKP
jgi:3'-5' exoribonuclease